MCRDPGTDEERPWKQNKQFTHTLLFHSCVYTPHTQGFAGHCELQRGVGIITALKELIIYLWGWFESAQRNKNNFHNSKVS